MVVQFSFIAPVHYSDVVIHFISLFFCIACVCPDVHQGPSSFFLLFIYLLQASIGIYAMIHHMIICLESYHKKCIDFLLIHRNFITVSMRHFLEKLYKTNQHKHSSSHIYIYIYICKWFSGTGSLHLPIHILV